MPWLRRFEKAGEDAPDIVENVGDRGGEFTNVLFANVGLIAQLVAIPQTFTDPGIHIAGKQVVVLDQALQVVLTSLLNCIIKWNGVAGEQLGGHEELLGRIAKSDIVVPSRSPVSHGARLKV